MTEQVTDTKPGESVPPGTTQAASVPEEGTTGKGSEDAGQAEPAEELEQLRQELTKKYERDIGRVKSTLQKQLAEAEKDWQQKEAEYKEKIAEARMSGMDEDQREAYENQLALERIKELEAEKNRYQQMFEAQRQMQEYYDYFTQQLGVPADKLNMTDANTLWQSGMRAVQELLQKTQQQKPPPEQPKQAPDVVTGTGSTAPKDRFAEWAKRLGGSEAVYRAIETGELDARHVFPPAESE